MRFPVTDNPVHRTLYGFRTDTRSLLSSSVRCPKYWNVNINFTISWRTKWKYIIAVRVESIALLLLFLIASVLSAQKPQPSSLSVPDAATAVRIAEPALIKVYGKHQIDSEKPLTARLDDGVWSVHGTLCCPDRHGRRTCEIGRCVGGVAVLKLRQRDGKVLSISHGK